MTTSQDATIIARMVVKPVVANSVCIRTQETVKFSVGGLPVPVVRARRSRARTRQTAQSTLLLSVVAAIRVPSAHPVIEQWARSIRLLRNQSHDRRHILRRQRIVANPFVDDHGDRPAELLVAFFDDARLAVSHGSRLPQT